MIRLIHIAPWNAGSFPCPAMLVGDVIQTLDSDLRLDLVIPTGDSEHRVTAAGLLRIDSSYYSIVEDPEFSFWVNAGDSICEHHSDIQHQHLKLCALL